MRLLSVIHGPAFGGAHNQALCLAEPLARLGVSTTVALPSEAGEAADRLRRGGIEVLPMPLGRVRASPRPGPHLRLARALRGDMGRLRAAIRATGADVVQVHGPTNPQAALAARLEPETAVVWQLLDTRTPVPLRHALMPLVTRLADSITTWGRRLADEHPGTTRLGERVLTVYPPVGDRFRPPGEEEREEARRRLSVAGSPLVGSVGVLNPQKGHEHLIAALAEVARSVPEVRGRIIGADSPGHPDYRRLLEARARELGLDRDGRLGIVDPGAEVAALLAGLDLFVLASARRSEGMPTAILEAMACGLPVVATDVGAVDELVEDGVTGMLVAPEDPQALASAIAELLADPDRAAALGRAGRARAVERFGIEALAERHHRAYEIALAHRRGPAG
jgi:glycosyltransferase involved in cell wall biosynthesis